MQLCHCLHGSPPLQMVDLAGTPVTLGTKAGMGFYSISEGDAEASMGGISHDSAARAVAVAHGSFGLLCRSWCNWP